MSEAETKKYSVRKIIPEDPRFPWGVYESLPQGGSVLVGRFELHDVAVKVMKVLES